MNNTETDDFDYGIWYHLGVLIVGFLTFGGVWIYSLSEWGFLIGLMFGWIPALIAGIALGYAWPLVVAFVIYLLLM